MSKKLPRFLAVEARPLSGNASLMRLLQEHNKGRAAWFFDLDGTLIHAKPGENVNVPPDRTLQAMLNKLADRTGGAVAIITGRPRIFVETLLPLRNYPTGVEHGAILQEKPRGAWTRRSKVEKEELDEIRALIEAEIKNIAGAQIEDHKQGTLTVEFTQAANPDALADRLEAQLRTIMQARAARGDRAPIDILRATVPGNYVIELLPQGVGKAQAVDHLMATASFKGKIPVFCGDSQGDEGAMRRVRELGGIAIGIGPKAPTCRDVHFADVAAMRAFITHAVRMPAPKTP